MCVSVVEWTLGCFETNSNQKMQLYLQNILLDTRISPCWHCWILKTFLCSSITVQKLPNNVKTWKLSFCIIWVFLRKLSFTSRAMRSFYFTFFQSQQNSLKLGNQRNFDFFDFLRSVLAIFQPKSANISLRANWIKRSIFVERLPSFGIQNASKCRHRLLKNNDVESKKCWCFWSKTLQRSLQKMFA